MTAQLSHRTPTGASGAPTASPAPRLAAHKVSLGYGARDVVGNLTLEIPPGKVTCVVGPNACGKSTLLRGLARLLAPRSGAVLLDGDDIRRLPTRTVARRLAMLPQEPIAPEGLTVRGLVERGRYPHRRFGAGGDDSGKVERAMAQVGVAELADRPVDELSGGQRQRVWIAMALAQETQLLLLDEPTAFLDIAHQLEILALLRDLCARGVTVVMVVHDLLSACRVADWIVAMRDGRITAQGEPSDVVTARTVRDVFDVDAVVIADPVTGGPLVVPKPLARPGADEPGARG